MQPISNDTPQWIGFGIQKELADELLLAEVAKEVVASLRSRGVSHTQVMIEAYHTISSLIREQPSSANRSPLAQITFALHIFCMAFPRSAERIPSFPPALSSQQLPGSEEDSPAKPDLSADQERLSSEEDLSLQLLPVRTKRARGRSQRKRSPVELDNTEAVLRQTQLHTMPYPEYLNTPEWQARRKHKLKQAEYRCQVCNTGNLRLDVHHRTYERRGNENDQDLVVLCETCHTL